jgi:hypothetical protein
MKKYFSIASVMILIVLLMSLVPSAGAVGATVTLLNPPPDGLLELDVGESYTFEILVHSDEPYILAMAMTDAYYPGRGVSWNGNDIAHHGQDAVLYLTMTGKSSTAGLAAVYGWPAPETNWEEGTAPVSIAAGVRYKGGVVYSERFNFAVVVP